MGLLAFDIAGGDAGVALGTALTIKMVAYVSVSPVMSALPSRLPRKPVLVAADVLPAGELRALLAMNLVVVAVTAMVLVNTVLLVRGHMGRLDGDVALLVGVWLALGAATSLILTPSAHTPGQRTSGPTGLFPGAARFSPFSGDGHRTSTCRQPCTAPWRRNLGPEPRPARLDV